jgi:hypothetical protein
MSMVWLLPRLSSQRARITVSSGITIASESTSTNNANWPLIGSCSSSRTLSIVWISSLLVLWLCLNHIIGCAHWESVGNSPIRTLTSSSWSLRCISLLMIRHELFLLVIDHHLVDDLVVSRLLYQWCWSHLGVNMTFRKVACNACDQLLSILVRRCIGSHAASCSLNLHDICWVLVVLWVWNLICIDLIR